MRRVIIMRGLPGSGKTTKANKLLNEYNGIGYSTAHCSADDYFMEDGEYKFNPKLIGNAHTSCMRRFLENTVHFPKDVVVVDNTNIHVWEFMPYVAVALAEGYEVQIQEVYTSVENCLKRQTHNVPESTIWRMHNTFEQVLPQHRMFNVVETDGNSETRR